MKIYPTKFAVYTHTLNNKVIYVGMGRGGRFAQVGAERTRKWHRVVGDSTSIEIKILAWLDDKESALFLESRAILLFNPEINKPMKVCLVGRGGQLCVVFNARQAELLNLIAGQPVMIESGKFDSRFGILIVPIRCSGQGTSADGDPAADTGPGAPE